MSAALPWFRMYSKVMTDPAMEFLSFEDQRHFVWVLCIKNDGYLDKGYESSKLDRMMGIKLGVQGDHLQGVKQRLMEEELIDSEWQPRGWSEAQKPSDSSSLRVKKHREKAAKKPPEETDVTAVKRYSNGLDKNREDIDNKPLVSSGKPKPDSAMVIETYHEILPELQSVIPSRFSGSAREKTLRARWNEDPKHQTPQFWQWFFESVRRNPHWLGDNARKWKADLGWLLERKHFDAVLELGNGE